MAVSCTILLTIRTIDIESITPSGRIQASEFIAMERSLEIALNGSSVAKLSCSPGLEKELAVGFLVTGKLISGYSAIESCRVSDDVCRITTSDVTDPAVTPHEPLRAVSFRMVVDAVESLLHEQRTHSATGGTHAALVQDVRSDWTISVEDVSRTAALCKAIGAAAAEKIDLAHCLAATTGRLTSELVRMCANAGVPLLASRAVATDLGVRIAAERDLTLLGAVRKDHSWLYNEGACGLVLDS